MQPNPNDWIVSNLHNGLSRRRVLAGVATVAGGGTAITLAASQSARAEVGVEDVSIQDASFEAEAVDPIVDVTVAYAYRYDAPTELHIELLVGDEPVASESLRTGRAELENTTTLSGRVVDAAAWELSDFRVAPNETVTRDIDVGVRFAVVDVDEVVAEDAASDTAEIEVTHPDESVAQVGMTGEITRNE